MNRLVVVIWLVVVALVAVVTGCDRAPRYDRRLVAADSLMQPDPDSALALVEAVEPGSLKAEGDRAYRDLLLTQGRYRCYITATSDSDINRALGYYRQHDGEREKLTRAFIYKGAVMEELGHPDSAMAYYKTAEATAAPDDYFNLGYVNLRMGELYKNLYLDNETTIKRMRASYHYFKLVNDTDYLITAIGTQGLYPKIIGTDSAMRCLERAISLAKTINSPKRFQFQSKLAGLLFYAGHYQRAKELSLDILSNGKEESNEILYYYYAARSFLRLGKVDSAYYILSLVPNPVTMVDSMNHHRLLAELSEVTGNRIEQESNASRAENIHRRILEMSLQSTAPAVEMQYDVLQQKNEGRSKVYTIIGIGCAIMLVLVTLLAIASYIIRQKIQQYKNELELTTQDLERLMDNCDKIESQLLQERRSHKAVLESKEKELRNLDKKNSRLQASQQDMHRLVSTIVKNRHAAINELYHEIKIKHNYQGMKNKQSVISLVSLIKELGERRELLKLDLKDSFWRRIKTSVDGEFQGIASYIEKKYPALPIRDQHLFWLWCANFSPQLIKLCMNYSNPATSSNYKRTFIIEKFGLDLSFKEYIQLYLDGKLDDSGIFPHQ